MLDALPRRDFLRMVAVLTTTAGAGGSILVACTGSGSDEQGDGQTGSSAVARTLTVRVPSDFDVLDPQNPIAASDYEPWSSFAEGLVGFVPGSWDVANDLAESFESSTDGLEHTFTLKQGIPFQGGYGEVTAEDVKFSFERILGLTKPKFESAYKSQWPSLEEIEITGKYSGVIRIGEPFAPFMTITLPDFPGTVISKAAVNDRGAEFSRLPISTGPYEVVDTSAKEVVLQRFTDYGGARSAYAPQGLQWDEIVFRVVPDDSTAIVALESGELDTSLLPYSSVSRFESEPDFSVENFAEPSVWWIAMNVLHPNLEDERVREAIRSAIDVPSIITGAYEDLVTRARSLISPADVVGFWEDAPPHDRNLDMARTLVAEAGAAGLELTFAFNGQRDEARTVGEIVQANLAEIDLTLRVTPLDPGQFNDISLGSIDEMELTYNWFGASPDPYEITQWFTCDQTQGKGYNMMNDCIPRYDELFIAASREFDTSARNDMYIEMQKQMDERISTVWIHHPTRFYATRSGLQLVRQPNGYAHYWTARDEA